MIKKIFPILLASTLFCTVPLTTLSCITTEKTLTTTDNKLVLSPAEFVKQPAINSILDEYYKKDSFETKSASEMEKEKNDYIVSQLSDENIKKLTNELKTIFDYYSIAEQQTYSVWSDRSSGDINYFNKYQSKWQDFISKNWLFTLYSIHKIESVGSSEVVVQEGGEFSLKYASFMPWKIRTKTNKIEQYASFIVPGSIIDEDGDSKGLSPKNGNDWQIYFETFYLKLKNKSIVSVQIQRELDPDTQKLVKKINLFINGRIYVFKKVSNGEVKDFNIADVARYLLRYQNDINSKYALPYPFDIPKVDDLRWDRVEELYGDLVPYLPAAFKEVK